jgi:hypothetical protein
VSRPLAALAALAALVPAGSAAAAGFWLPSPNDPVTPPPPLRPGAAAQSTSELKVPGRVDTSERIVVGVGPDGRPVRITATQRLDIIGTGDYSFVIPAPATSVVPGPGSASQPGLRDVGIIWQGFSDHDRVLSATVTLRPADASAGLPVRVRIERDGSSAVVRLTNLTTRQVNVSAGRTTLAQLRRVTHQLRNSYRRARLLAGSLYLTGTPGTNTKIAVSAPLHVTGTISQGATRTPVDAVLGGGAALERSFVLRGATAPELDLRIDLPTPLEVLPTPSALGDAPRPLEALQTALGAIATTSAYGRYLDTPNPGGRIRTSFVYRSAPRAAAVAAPGRGGGSDTLVVVLAIALGTLGLAGLAVLWARS